MTTSSSPKLIYLLSVADRQVQQWMKQHMPKDFPSPAQAGVLFALKQHDGLLMGEISTRIQIAASSLSGLIQRMEEAHLIQRQTCLHDARATRIYLTSKSRELLPRLIDFTQAFNQQLQEDFNDEEIQVVERWLKHLSQKFPQQN